MGELLHLPPRYRVAYRKGDLEGYVVDEATGRDWDTRDVNEAAWRLEQLRQQFDGVLFWVTSGG